MDCPKCGKPVPELVGPGRPRKFCGDVCKRSAEMELRRLGARITKLEISESTYRIKGATVWAAGAAVEIKRLEARMAELLDDSEHELTDKKELA